MVEAVIIIASFVMFMLAITFFRELYMKKIRSGLLARAGALAYSMRGCPEGGADGDPANWERGDISPGNASSRPPLTKSTAPYQGNATAAGTGADVMRDVPGGGADGALNPIVDFGLSITAAATTKDGLLRPRRGFRKQLSSISHMSCGDVVRNGQFSEVFNIAKSHLPL
jgi:hypothetical protein